MTCSRVIGKTLTDLVILGHKLGAAMPCCVYTSLANQLQEREDPHLSVVWTDVPW